MENGVELKKEETTDNDIKKSLKKSKINGTLSKINNSLFHVIIFIIAFILAMLFIICLRNIKFNPKGEGVLNILGSKQSIFFKDSDFEIKEKILGGLSSDCMIYILKDKATNEEYIIIKEGENYFITHRENYNGGENK